MLNRPEDTSQIYEVTGSRRTFFTWIGQVAAGASLVGIGLGLVNPYIYSIVPPAKEVEYLYQRRSDFGKNLLFNVRKTNPYSTNNRNEG